MRQEAIETRLDICALATCALAFEAQGIPVRSKSGLVATCVSSLAAALVDNNAVPRVEDTKAAKVIIERVLTPPQLNTGMLSIRSIAQQVKDAAAKLNSQTEGDL